MQFLKNKLVYGLAIFNIATMLAACANHGNETNSLSSEGGGIYADVSAIVPISDPYNAGNATFILHNTSNQIIKNIQYTYSNNVNNQENRIASCQQITPHGTCSITIPLAKINHFSNFGASLLKFSYYNQQGLNVNGSALTSYRYFENTESGVHILPITLMPTTDHKSRGVIYLYAGGAKGSKYTLTKLSLSNPAFKINANYSKLNIEEGVRIPLEITGPELNQPTALNLQLDSIDQNGNTYSDHASIGVNASNGDTTIVPSLIPVINTDDEKSANGGSAWFLNAGGSPINIQNPTSSNKLLQIDSTKSSCKAGILDAGTSCEVVFTVPHNTIGVKHSNIILPTKDNSSISSPVSWYNRSPDGGLIVLPDQPTIVVDESTGTKVTVTVYNIGGFDLDSPGIITPVIDGGHGSVTAAQFNPQCEAIPAHKSCSYSFVVKDKADKIGGDIEFGAQASYKVNEDSFNTADRQRIPYYTSGNVPQITVDPALSSLNVKDNGKESKTLDIKFTNSGGGNARIATAKFLAGATPYLYVLANSCKDTILMQNNSCTLNLRLGPVPSGTDITTSNIYQLTGNWDTTKHPVQVIINTNDINLSFTATPNFGDAPAEGSGSKDEPYIYYSTSTSPQSINLTLNNDGGMEQNIDQINTPDGLDNSVWALDRQSSSCFANGSPDTPGLKLVLPGGKSCNIVYNNIYGTLPNDQLDSSGVYSSKFANVEVSVKTRNAGIQVLNLPPNKNDPIYVSNSYPILYTTGSTDLHQSPIATTTKHWLTNLKQNVNFQFELHYPRDAVKPTDGINECSGKAIGEEYIYTCNIDRNATKDNPLINIATLQAKDDFDIQVVRLTETAQYYKLVPESEHVILMHRQYFTHSPVHPTQWKSIHDLDKECTTDMNANGKTGKWIAVVAYGAYDEGRHEGLPECEPDTEYYTEGNHKTYTSGPANHYGIADCYYDHATYKYPLNDGSSYDKEYFITGLYSNNEDGMNPYPLNCGDWVGSASPATCHAEEVLLYGEDPWGIVPSFPIFLQTLGLGGSKADPSRSDEFTITTGFKLQVFDYAGLLCTQWFPAMANNSR